MEQEQSDCIRLPRFLADPLSLTDRSLSIIDRHGETVTRQARHSISRTFNGADPAPLLPGSDLGGNIFSALCDVATLHSIAKACDPSSS